MFDTPSCGIVHEKLLSNEISHKLWGCKLRKRAFQLNCTQALGFRYSLIELASNLIPESPHRPKWEFKLCRRILLKVPQCYGRSSSVLNEIQNYLWILQTSLGAIALRDSSVIAIIASYQSQLCQRSFHALSFTATISLDSSRIHHFETIGSRSTSKMQSRVFKLLLASVLLTAVLACKRLPPKTLNAGRMQSGDNGYRLVIGNDQGDGYEPGKTYNCTY